MTTTAELADKAHLAVKRGECGTSYTFTHGQLEEFRRLAIEDAYKEGLVAKVVKDGYSLSERATDCDRFSAHPFSVDGVNGCGGACKKAEHD